jgi:hypothetical protein
MSKIRTSDLKVVWVACYGGSILVHDDTHLAKSS